MQCLQSPYGYKLGQTGQQKASLLLLLNFLFLSFAYAFKSCDYKT